MKISVILAHPNEESFNHAIARTVVEQLETIWRNCVFGLCGVNTFHRRTFSVVVTSTEREREEWLDEVRETMNKYFPVSDERAAYLNGCGRICRPGAKICR